jgi:TP901 family phage tail tape measure protein
MAIFIPLVTRFDPKGLDGAQRALAQFSNFATQVARVAAAAIAGIAVLSTREAMQFETSLSKIQGLVGLTSAEVDDLAAAARRIAPAFGASATEAADALFFITSAGLRGAAATNVLEASLKGAAIGLGDAKTIADLATSAVNAYGESNLDGAKAVDILAEAVRLGKLEPAELAGAMGQVLPLASNLGVSFAEVGAAMAGMSKTGTDASTAATQLRQILATLAKPTSEANRGLADMGLSAEGLRQQIREKGLFSALETLTTAFDGNIEATSTVFGNIRALSGVLDLMGESVDDNRELFALMTDEIGVLDEAFGIVSDTTEFKFKKAMATAKDGLLGIGLAIVERLQPHLDVFLSWLDENGPVIADTFANMFEDLFNFIESAAVQDLVKQFADLWPQIRDTAFQIGELVIKLVPLLLGALEKVLPMLRDLSSIAEDLIYFIDEVVNSFGNWGIETPAIVDWLEKQINPMARLADALQRLASMLDTARTAYERFQAAGGIIGAADRAVGSGKVGTQFGLTGRASGGPVSSSRSYLVGEMGPEIFTPSAGGGNITPNSGMGGAVYNITINAGMGSPDGARLGEQIVSAIRRYERSSGKVFQSA